MSFDRDWALAIVLLACGVAVIAFGSKPAKAEACAKRAAPSEFTCIREKHRDVYGLEVWACARFTGEP